MIERPHEQLVSFLESDIAIEVARTANQQTQAQSTLTASAVLAAGYALTPQSEITTCFGTWVGWIGLAAILLSAGCALVVAWPVNGWRVDVDDYRTWFAGDVMYQPATSIEDALELLDDRFEILGDFQKGTSRRRWWLMGSLILIVVAFVCVALRHLAG